jgi:hypothetical protein
LVDGSDERTRDLRILRRCEMATRKKPAKKSKKTRTTRKTREPAKRDDETKAKSKFHGKIEHSVEEPGDKIKDDDHVVVSIRELSFGRLPESYGRAELMFDITLSTTSADGKPVHATHNSGVFFYVPHHATLNVDDWVVFDGKVRQHLSLQVEITELEDARKKQKENVELVKTIAEMFGKLPIPLPDPASAVLKIIPAVYGAVLAANADDQVLKYFTSLHAGEPGKDGPPELIEGTHVFEKRKLGSKPGSTPFVTLKLRIRRA